MVGIVNIQQTISNFIFLKKIEMMWRHTLFQLYGVIAPNRSGVKVQSM